MTKYAKLEAWGLAALLTTLPALLLWQTGCEQAPPDGALPAASAELPLCASASGAEPISPALLAFLSRSRSAHHRADNLEDENPEAAVAVLTEVVTGPLPNTSAPEVREVVADTRARLADIRSRQGDHAAALAEVEKGLELAREVTYFRGHLFEMRGHVEERHAKALAADGHESDADAAKKRALAAFEESMKIQAKVIEQALPSPTEGSP